MKTKNDLHIPFSWEERRPVFLERFFYLPKAIEHDLNREKINWSDETIFGNDRPVCIEICSGNGQWIGDRAKERPDLNWVAVDLDFGRARKTWLKSYREGIPNLYVVCGEGTAFLRHYVSPKSIFQSFVNFPDPWPKLRHAKHRLIQKPFLEALSSVLIDGAVATFVTDDAPYRDQMIRELGKLAPWRPILPEPHYHVDWSAYGDSYFAALWKERNRTIYYIQYTNG